MIIGLPKGKAMECAKEGDFSYNKNQKKVPVHKMMKAVPT